MSKIEFSDIQRNVNQLLQEIYVTPGSGHALLLEMVYVRALRDVGVTIPVAVDVFHMCGRDVATHNSTSNNS